MRRPACARPPAAAPSSQTRGPCGRWGETFFIFFQNLIILILFYRYTLGSFLSPTILATLASHAILGATLYLRLVPPIDVCTPLGLQSCILTSESIAGGLPIVLLLFSRLPQIWQNLRQGHTGVLAFPTYLLTTLGGLARVFMILQEVDDKLVLAGAVSAFAQNGTILLQMILYRAANREQAAAAKAAEEKRRQ